MDFNQTALAFVLEPRRAAREASRKERLLEGSLIYAAALVSGALFFTWLPGDLDKGFGDLFPALSLRPFTAQQWGLYEGLGVLVDVVGIVVLWSVLRAARGRISLTQTLGISLWLHLFEFPILLGSTLGVALRSPEVTLLAALGGLGLSLRAGVLSLRELSGVRTPGAFFALLLATFAAPALTGWVLVQAGLIAKDQMMVAMMLR